MAELKFFGYLADLSGCRKKVITLEKAIPLRELLPPRFPEGNVIVLINEKPGNLDHPIQDEDTVLLMPVLSGG